MPHSINYKKQNQAKAKHHVYKSLSPSPSTTKSFVGFNFRYLMALFHPIRVSLPSIHVTIVFFLSIVVYVFFCSLNYSFVSSSCSFDVALLFTYVVWWCLIAICYYYSMTSHSYSKMPTCYSLLLFNGASLLLLDLVATTT
jgi:CDP-diglyceride synthetase